MNNNKHGHGVRWMSTGGKNGLRCRTHTEWCLLFSSFFSRYGGGPLSRTVNFGTQARKSYFVFSHQLHFLIYGLFSRPRFNRVERLSFIIFACIVKITYYHVREKTESTSRRCWPHGLTRCVMFFGSRGNDNEPIFSIFVRTVDDVVYHHPYMQRSHGTIDAGPTRSKGRSLGWIKATNNLRQGY